MYVIAAELNLTSETNLFSKESRYDFFFHTGFFLLARTLSSVFKKIVSEFPEIVSDSFLPIVNIIGKPVHPHIKVRIE